MMTQTGQALLLQVLVDDYGLLKGRLTRRLGSPDAADEVLQEAYLRVERMPTLGTVFHPRTYLFRMALNIAADRYRSERRRLARSEVELLLRLEHDELHPERIAEARSSARALVQALDDLPPRRRAIVVAARVEGLTVVKIAARFGVSTRFIERELKLALDHCRDRLEINLSHRFGASRSETPKD
jgi:RNA polymerase sigma factor (sigma-70 family)